MKRIVNKVNNMTAIRLTILLTLSFLSPAWSGGSEFNGTTSGITIANQAALNSLQFTCGCWARYETFGEGAAGRILTHGTAWDIRLLDSTPDRVRFVVAGWSTQGIWDILMPPATTWFHYAVSYDASSLANVPTVYLDGVAQSFATTTTPAGTFTLGTGALWIGDNTTNIRSWDGQLAECVYYDRILSAPEVRSLAFVGPLAVPKPIVYQPLGVFGAKNYTSTAGLDGTATAVTLSVIAGPPLGYGPQTEN